MGKVLKCDFQKIIDNPFVFYQREYAEDGSYYYWLARGGVVSGTMKESAFDSKRYVYTLEEGLGICDISTSYENGKYLEVEVTPFSFSSYNHIKKLFAYFLAQISHSAYTKYGTSNCKEILFCLNNLDWNEFLLIKVLKEFSNDDIIKTTLLSRYFNATNTNKQESISQLLLQISEIVDFSKFDN